ncbi:MAG: hypothetical protein NUW37_16920 [Planctomycetes bacterium]|nr:hypothetical protein [Planctomycetota bacterium]
METKVANKNSDLAFAPEIRGGTPHAVNFVACVFVRDYQAIPAW